MDSLLINAGILQMLTFHLDHRAMIMTQIVLNLVDALLELLYEQICCQMLIGLVDDEIIIYEVVL